MYHNIVFKSTSIHGSSGKKKVILYGFNCGWFIVIRLVVSGKRKEREKRENFD